MPQELVKEKVEKELKEMVAKEKQSIEKPEEKKAREDKLKQEQDAQKAAEAQKAKDAAILAKKEEERTEEEKQRVKAVADEKAKEEEKKRLEEEAKLSADEKIKRIQEKSQKRIDEIKGELNEIKDKSSKEAQELRRELEAIRLENAQLRSKTEPSENTLDELESTRIGKYVKDDESKDREKRREMSKEELDSWYLEDAVSATDWMLRRNRRREIERNADYKKSFADDLVKKQQESLKRVIARHPELNIKSQVEALKAQGKTDDEIKGILKESVEKVKLLSEITKEKPEYLSSEDGPERAVEEMERRIKTTPKTDTTEKDKRIDDLTTKVEELTAEIARLSNSDEGINSTIQRQRIDEKKLTEMENELVKTMKDLGASEDRIQSALKKFRAKKNA